MRQLFIQATNNQNFDDIIVSPITKVMSLNPRYNFRINNYNELNKVLSCNHYSIGIYQFFNLDGDLQREKFSILISKYIKYTNDFRGKYFIHDDYVKQYINNNNCFCIKYTVFPAENITASIHNINENITNQLKSTSYIKTLNNSILKSMTIIKNNCYWIYDNTFTYQQNDKLDVFFCCIIKEYLFFSSFKVPITFISDREINVKNILDLANMTAIVRFKQLINKDITNQTNFFINLKDRLNARAVLQSLI